MKLDEIWAEWEVDSGYDERDLGKDSLRIVKLYTKYLRILSNERNTLKMYQEKWEVKMLPKFEYFSGITPLEILKEKGIKPFGKMVSPKDIEKYLNADEELRPVRRDITFQEEKISVLNSILEMIKNRSYHIRAAIDWQKFDAGSY